MLAILEYAAEEMKDKTGKAIKPAGHVVSWDLVKDLGMTYPGANACLNAYAKAKLFTKKKSRVEHKGRWHMIYDYNLTDLGTSRLRERGLTRGKGGFLGVKGD